MTSTEIAQVKTFDIAPVSQLWDEFLMRHARQQEDEKWLKLFKEKMAELSGGADSLTLNGIEVATHYRNGNFNAKNFEKEHPELVAKYTRLVQELKLDRKSLAADEPELYEQYKAKVFLVK